MLTLLFWAFILVPIVLKAADLVQWPWHLALLPTWFVLASLIAVLTAAFIVDWIHRNPKE